MDDFERALQQSNNKLLREIVQCQERMVGELVAIAENMERLSIAIEYLANAGQKHDR